MTNTEFFTRQRVPRIHFGLVDGALILGFLAAFLGMVVLLAK